jgi:hypothetical protein
MTEPTPERAPRTYLSVVLIVTAVVSVVALVVALVWRPLIAPLHGGHRPTTVLLVRAAQARRARRTQPGGLVASLILRPGDHRRDDAPPPGAHRADRTETPWPGRTPKPHPRPRARVAPFHFLPH